MASEDAFRPGPPGGMAAPRVDGAPGVGRGDHVRRPTVPGGRGTPWPTGPRGPRRDAGDSLFVRGPVKLRPVPPLSQDPGVRGPRGRRSVEETAHPGVERVRIRLARPADHRAIEAVYRARAAASAGPMVRTRAYWTARWRRAGGRSQRKHLGLVAG